MPFYTNEDGRYGIQYTMKLYELFEKCLTVPYTTVGVSASYAMERTGTTLYLFFEGSNGRNDWRNNLDFPATAYPDAPIPWRAHRGFLRTWQEIAPHIHPAVAEKSIRAITVAGYSHGGAIAMLCHEYVWRHRPDLRKRLWGYGFGAPRVLWGRRPPALLASWEQFTVVRNLDDLVTHLPPAALGYLHVGKMLTIGEKGKYSPVEAHLAENILAELSVYEGNSPTNRIT